MLLLPGCRPVPGSDGGAGPTETAAGDLTDYESGIYAIRADSTAPLMMGDVNRDGALTGADAVLALRAAVWNAEAKETLRNVLLYAESKGLPIVTAEYGFSHTYR